MEYLAVLPLGLIIGMTHALEADHLAAVSAMHKRNDNGLTLVKRGAFWGLGHTASLFVVCLAVFSLGLAIPAQLEAALEFLVGLMIILLGGMMLRRLRRERIHIHAHVHDGDRHVHVHSHAGEASKHSESRHRHRLALRKEDGKILAVGMVHGLAGSAGLLVLMVASADTLFQAMAYLAVFGLGSMIGMAALSAIVSLPLGMVQRLGGWAPAAVSVAIGIIAICVGGLLAIESFGEFYHLRG